MARKGLPVLVQLLLVLLQGLGVFLGRVSDQLLHVLHALLQRGVLLFPGLLVGLELAEVLVRACPQLLLHVPHPLLQAAVVLLPSLALALLLPQLPMQRVQLSLRLLQLLGVLAVPIRRVPQRLLQELQALLHRGMALLEGLGIAGHTAVGGARLSKLPAVLVVGVVDEPLQRGNPLLETGVALVQGLLLLPQALHVALGVLMAAPQLFQLLELPRVLVRRVPAQLLQVLHPLLERGVVLLLGALIPPQVRVGVLQRLQVAVVRLQEL
mmetsp:Transcript_1309/g.3062  ORF Transcript_1309/g.3062 Transcript_1309/m.3062 type:complete len:268 (+) Transcript_1309:348-1151(+)